MNRKVSSDNVRNVNTKKPTKPNNAVKKKPMDFSLLLATIVLVFIGLIMVFSSSWAESLKDYNSAYFFIKKQSIFAIMGFVLIMIVSNIDYRRYKKHVTALYVIGIVLDVILLFTPLGRDFKGAKRWISVAGFTFMPSDYIKLASIMFFAKYLADNAGKMHKIKDGMLPAFLIIGFSCGLIYIQKDLGTTITVAGTLFAMWLVAGMSLKFLTLAVVGGVSGMTILLNSIFSNPDLTSYKVRRIIAFRNPFEYKIDIGWQVVQSLYALGSGGAFGLGLGKSRQKFFYIPEAYNDFIFAIIGEELGFVGVALVIGLFLIIIYRGVKIAMGTKDLFGCYLATGITALISVQMLINIAVVTSSVPTTGITLPFVSYGGTSLLMYMSAVGILLNISRYAEFDRS